MEDKQKRTAVGLSGRLYVRHESLGDMLSKLSTAGLNIQRVTRSTGEDGDRWYVEFTYSVNTGELPD